MGVLLTSGCVHKTEYIPCVEYAPLTPSPVLDMNGTGKMYRLPDNRWSVTDMQIDRVLKFEKACYQRDADYISTSKAINVYNKTYTEVASEGSR